ncbi:MAG: DUF72 domain-containing protein [SAR202 cluster bacterium]|nr:DUF72 domain-containing protein [SAR202 cluster bacterium]
MNRGKDMAPTLVAEPRAYGSQLAVERHLPHRAGEFSNVPGARAFIGTQGWSFESWAGIFYPKGLPATERLARYSRTFNGVEVNTTFHAVPPASIVRNWRSSTPDGFKFSLKMPRAITHERRLRDPEPELSNFLNVAVELGEKLGAILVQLPPSFGAADLPALDGFLQSLPVREMRFCVEVRQRALRAPGVRDLLRRRGAGFVSTNLTSEPGDLEVVTGMTYLRLIGPRQVPDQSTATPCELDSEEFQRQAGSWAAAMLLVASSGMAAPFCFAANNFFGPGFLPAAYLMKQLGMPVELPSGSLLDMPVQGALL